MNSNLGSTTDDSIASYVGPFNLLHMYSYLTIIIRLWARDLYEVIVDEANVLVEFLLKFTSNNSFQLLFLDILLNFTPEKDRSDWIAI